MHDFSTSSAVARSAPSSSPPPATAEPTSASSHSPLDEIACSAALLDESGVVADANRAWRDDPQHAPALGDHYAVSLAGLMPGESDALAGLTDLLAAPLSSTGDVRERTFECQNHDTEHWFAVTISTVALGAGRARLVLHQDVTAQKQLERRHRLTQRLAAVQAVALDPALRTRRLAVCVGEALHASMVVLWERSATGQLRARPLETNQLAPQVATIAHTRQLLGVMDGDAAQWIRPGDGTACYAVPVKAHEQVVLLHFARRPRFDGETLRLVARALQSDPTARRDARAGRGRSPREIRRQLGHDAGPDSARLALHERLHIERTLALHRNNMLRTAQALGIARSTLYERIKDYGITVAPRVSPSPA